MLQHYFAGKLEESQLKEEKWMFDFFSFPWEVVELMANVFSFFK